MKAGLKILIIRFSSIGDIVLTTPIVRCLKLQLKDAEIHYLTKPQYQEILDTNPYIDKLHLLQESFSETITSLKREAFDIVIDLHHNLRSFRIKLALDAKSFAFPKLNIEKWLIVNLKWDRLPDLHIVERYFQTVSTLSIENDQKGLDFFIKPEEEISAPQLFSIQHPFVVFAIGGQHFTKKMPKKKILAICDQIKSPLILLGGAEDYEVAEWICKRSENKVFHACGSLSIGQSASLIKQAAAVISHDTGMMHIAAAFQQKILSLWGNTIPQFGMYPYQVADHKAMEIKDLNCRPCSKIGYNKCPQKHFYCMNLIDDFEVADWINKKVDSRLQLKPE